MNEDYCELCDRELDADSTEVCDFEDGHRFHYHCAFAEVT
jgi:hypothetical protein